MFDLGLVPRSIKSVDPVRFVVVGCRPRLALRTDFGISGPWYWNKGIEFETDLLLVLWSATSRASIHSLSRGAWAGFGLENEVSKTLGLAAIRMALLSFDSSFSALNCSIRLIRSRFPSLRDCVLARSPMLELRKWSKDFVRLRWRPGSDRND